MRAAAEDQAFLKQGRDYFCAILELKVAFADPIGSPASNAPVRGSVRCKNQQLWVLLMKTLDQGVGSVNDVG